MSRRTAAAMLAVILVAPPRTPAYGGVVSDAEARAIVQRHCVMCHAVRPTHESFQEAPKDVTLETLPDLKKNAALIYMQTVQSKAMPLGNQTGMTESERAALGRWVKALK